MSLNVPSSTLFRTALLLLWTCVFLDPAAYYVTAEVKCPWNTNLLTPERLLRRHPSAVLTKSNPRMPHFTFFVWNVSMKAKVSASLKCTVPRLSAGRYSPRPHGSQHQQYHPSTFPTALSYRLPTLVIRVDVPNVTAQAYGMSIKLHVQKARRTKALSGKGIHTLQASDHSIHCMQYHPHTLYLPISALTSLGEIDVKVLETFVFHGIESLVLGVSVLLVTPHSTLYQPPPSSSFGGTKQRDALASLSTRLLALHTEDMDEVASVYATEKGWSMKHSMIHLLPHMSMGTLTFRADEIYLHGDSKKDDDVEVEVDVDVDDDDDDDVEQAKDHPPGVLDPFPHLQLVWDYLLNDSADPGDALIASIYTTMPLTFRVPPRLYGSFYVEICLFIEFEDKWRVSDRTCLHIDAYSLFSIPPTRLDDEDVHTWSHTFEVPVHFNKARRLQKISIFCLVNHATFVQVHPMRVFITDAVNPFDSVLEEDWPPPNLTQVLLADNGVPPLRSGARGIPSPSPLVAPLSEVSLSRSLNPRTRVRVVFPRWKRTLLCLGVLCVALVALLLVAITKCYYGVKATRRISTEPHSLNRAWHSEPVAACVVLRPASNQPQGQSAIATEEVEKGLVRKEDLYDFD